MNEEIAGISIPLTYTEIPFKKDLSREDWHKLARHEDPFIRAAAARWQGCDAKMLEQFLYDRSPAVLAAAAGMPEAPESILKVALFSDEWAPRLEVCAHESAPFALVEHIYKTLTWSEKLALANNPSTPESILRLIVETPPDLRGDGKKMEDWAMDLRNRARRRLGMPLEKPPKEE